VVNPLGEYYEGVKGLIRDRCGDGVVLILSPPLTWADRLVDELVKELGEGKVRHYVIGSEGGREEAKSLTGIIKRIKNPVKEESKPLVGILKRIRDSIRRGEGLVVDEKLMNELRDLLGDDLVSGVKPDCIIPYYIAWEEASRYASDERVDEKVRDALGLIINGFERKGKRITWFGLDYIPEELVEEVKSAKSENVEGWVSAYLYIASKLNLDGGVLHVVKNVFGRFIEFIKASLPAIGKVMHVVPEFSTQIGTVTLSFIESLAKELAKDEVHAFRNIIDTVTHLKALRRDGDLNTLGKLIAYKLAVDMGIPYEVVHNVLIGFTGLADDVLRYIEERLDINLIKSQSVEGAFKVYDKGGFESNAEAHPGILIKDDELLISGGVIGGSAREPYKVVTTKGFNDLRDEVLKRLDDEGVVVLVGPRGIGKTTLATYTTWTLFKERGLKFMVNVKNLEKGTEFTGFIGYYLDNKYDDKYGDLLVVYDPSTTKTYSLADKKTEVPKGISSTIDTLLKSIAEDEKVRGRVRLLVVLPTDIHQALSQDLKDRLGKYVLDLEEKGFLKDPELIAEVIREYAKGCNIDYDKAKALADEILGRFSEGYTLIARLTGTLIASKYECRVDDVKSIINESKGNAHYLILRYINGLFKVDKNPDVAKTLVKIFALRRPFVNEVRPGDPILTPGIVELISEKKGASLLYSAEGKELRGWLAIRQHDLIEESIEELLKCVVSEGEECKKFDDELLEPWREAHVPKIRSRADAVKYFARKHGKRFIEKIRRHRNCWKRAALIIGHALAGIPTVPRLEDLPSDVVGSLGDALNKCEIDDYLLVGNVIPPLIWYLIKNHARALTKAFVGRYNEAVVEVRRVLNIARGRGGIYVAEGLYGLGLASIIAKAVKLNKDVESGGADAALHIASSAIQYVTSLNLIMPILCALKPLRGKAPHRYLELLAPIPEIENLDSGTVRYVFDGLNEVLNKYGDVVEGHAWSLVYAIDAYANLLGKHRSYFDDDEVKGVVGRVADLLNELDKLSPSLGVIAWAYALAPALRHEDVRRLMEKALRIDVVDKANGILEELSGLMGRVQELMRDEEFMDYVESKHIKADEEAVRRSILEASSLLRHALAIYRRNNDEFYEAEELFNETAEERREIGDYENYLVARGLALRTEAIKGSLVGDELAHGFRQLYEEAFNEEHFIPTAEYLGIASHVLGNYLVSLALTGDHETISKLLEKHWRVLNADRRVSVLTRLMLNALLGHRVGLSGELKGRLSVNPGELINAFETGMYGKFLPALGVALGIVKSEDVGKMCVLINDSIKGERMVCGDYVIEWLRLGLVDDFRESLIEEFSRLKELGINADKLLDEFMKLVVRLDGKSLTQLIAPRSSMARLALMLHALVNGDEELAKAHALKGAVDVSEKLLARLFLETYEACCDLNSESFRRAIAKLFFYYV